MGRQHQGMDRPGVRQVPEGSGEQGKNGEKKTKKLVAKSSVLPQRPSRLRDWWWWWWWPRTSWAHSRFTDKSVKTRHCRTKQSASYWKPAKTHLLGPCDSCNISYPCKQGRMWSRYARRQNSSNSWNLKTPKPILSLLWDAPVKCFGWKKNKNCRE